MEPNAGTSGVERQVVALMPALALCVLGYGITLQVYGFYDIWDGIRYLGGGISLIVDGLGSPLPIFYKSGLAMTDFAEPRILTYASIPFQLWAALTAGITQPAIIKVVVAHSVLYVLSGLYVYALARTLVSAEVGLLAVGVLCAGLAIGDLYSKTMIRPLPDAFLVLCFVASVYHMRSGQAFLAGLWAAIGVTFKLQGVEFLWLAALLSQDRRQFTMFVLTMIAGFVTINVWLQGFESQGGAGNYGFYLSVAGSVPLTTVILRCITELPATLIALLGTWTYVATLAVTPLMLIGAWLTPNKDHARFIGFAVATAHWVAWTSYHTMSIFLGGGYDERYLVYPIPLVVVATFVATKRLLPERAWVRYSMVGLAFAVLLVPALRADWHENRLDVSFPELGLASLSSPALVGIGSAEYASFEIYAASKNRTMVWLPYDRAEFLAGDNRHFDYLIFGGRWEDPYASWNNLTDGSKPIRDAFGNEFTLVQRTDYYRIFKRSALSVPSGR